MGRKTQTGENQEQSGPSCECQNGHLQPAEKLESFLEAFKVAGIARSSFYETKKAYERFGREEHICPALINNYRETGLDGPVLSGQLQLLNRLSSRFYIDRVLETRPLQNFFDSKSLIFGKIKIRMGQKVHILQAAAAAWIIKKMINS